MMAAVCDRPVLRKVTFCMFVGEENQNTVLLAAGTGTGIAPPTADGNVKGGTMKNDKIRFVVPLLAFACALTAAKVMTDYSHSTDFSRYKTYSWLKVEAGNPLWPDRIRVAVDSQLAARGMTQVPDGGDASVAAFGSTHTQPQIETFYTGFGGGWFWRGFGDGMATTTVQNISVGTLVVDLFDTPSKKLIWRGIANDTLTGKPEKNERKLENAAEDMFKHFPPRSKG